MQMELDEWPVEVGVIKHSSKTRERVLDLLDDLERQRLCTVDQALKLLAAADVACNMAMWLTVHMTYVNDVFLDGRTLKAPNFKTAPQGHTGGALNMVPAYVGYLLANALTGKTRAWIMGQGHCVAAIESVNVLLRNLEPEQADAYPLTDAGLSRLCQDFYGYQHDASGIPTAPVGSHVNAYTGGGVMEGGYLGFAGLQYPHMPLPGQELVAFLSDGAFEEQRGSDWAPRWWRGEDTGAVMPIMIANGRRIEQRTSISQKGGVEWLSEHLRLNGFDPVEIDGRDPAAFAWAIITMEAKLSDTYAEIKAGSTNYPIRLPYAIAETTKGYGFPGAGTNAAHNLPIKQNPSVSERGRVLFNDGASRLFMPTSQLRSATKLLSNHANQHRRLEKDHCLRTFSSPLIKVPEVDVPSPVQSISPMSAIDDWFVNFARLNYKQRIRIGNPDELRSNRLNKTLDYLKHRVAVPEANLAEAVTGSVITALNEEAVVSAVFANKQGINLAVSYEAFAVKMLGAMRQEIIFARNMRLAGRVNNWLGVPIVVTSHTWENGKNEISHQDTTLCEAWLQEMTDVAPVYFPFDSATSIAVLQSVYQQTGRVAVVVVPKGEFQTRLTMPEAKIAVEQGALIIKPNPGADIQLLSIGAYQLLAVEEAAKQLAQQGVSCEIITILEPSRFREPRDPLEADFCHDSSTIKSIIPECKHRVVVSHTRTDVITGVLRALDNGPDTTVFMGYENNGGTLDVEGMQIANRQSAADISKRCLQLLGRLP